MLKVCVCNQPHTLLLATYQSWIVPSTSPWPSPSPWQSPRPSSWPPTAAPLSAARTRSILWSQFSPVCVHIIRLICQFYTHVGSFGNIMGISKFRNWSRLIESPCSSFNHFNGYTETHDVLSNRVKRFNRYKRVHYMCAEACNSIGNRQPGNYHIHMIGMYFTINHSLHQSAITCV